MRRPPSSTLFPYATLSRSSPTNGQWTDGTHYTVDYTVADVGVTLAAVKFDVSGAKDLAGNTQLAATAVTTSTEDHTSELQSHSNALCRLHLAKQHTTLIST